MHRQENESKLVGTSRRSGKRRSSQPATHVQVVPTKLILKPGDKVSFRPDSSTRRVTSFAKSLRQTGRWNSLKARSRTASSQPARSSPAGGISESRCRRREGNRQRARLSTTTLEGKFRFFGRQLSATCMGEHDNEVRGARSNGNKVLAKLTEGSSLLSRSRAYMGPSDWSNYTVEADVFGDSEATPARRRRCHRATLRFDSLRQQPDAASGAGNLKLPARRACHLPGSPTPGIV